MRYISLRVRLFALMALSILTSTVRYLDSAAIYLTEDQMKAAYLELRISIVAMQSPISASFRRNPAQSVYGYLTTCYQECVYDEVECRFDYQSLYRSIDSFQLLAQLDCIYYRAIATNQDSIASANTTQGPYSILQVDGLTTTLRRPVDSFRFKGLNPCVFDMILFWSFDDTDYGTCGIEVIDLPPILPPSENAPGYDPDRNSNPNAAIASETPSPPTDEDATIVPEDSPSNDFGSRNDFEPPPLYPPGTRGTWSVIARYRVSASAPIQEYPLTAQGIYSPAPYVESGPGGASLIITGIFGPQSFLMNTSPFPPGIVLPIELISFTPL